VTSDDWYRYLHDMVYVYYKVFHYTNLVMFSETSMQSDVLCPFQYLKQIRLVYNSFLQLLNTRLILLWIMTSNWFLMYVYRLITWYRKLGKQQQLFMKVSMRLDLLWSTLRSIYIVMDFKRLERFSVLKQH
jgi:hypothetical protein